MDWSRIDHLVDRYYAGETSLDEEKELRTALLRKDVPEHLTAEAAMMGFFEEARVEAPVIPLTPNVSEGGSSASVSIAPRKTISLMIRQFTAAAVVVIFGVFAINTFGPKNISDCEQKAYATINGVEVCNSEQAKEEAQKALSLISSQLNKGTQDLRHLKKLNKPKELTNKIK